MHYGIELIPFGTYSDPREVVRVAQAAEAAGWEALCLWDHVVMPYGTGDPWVALAAVAVATRHIKLITGVAPLPRYRPHLLARTLAALDWLSAGRVIFGVGAGVDFDFTPFGEAAEAKTRAAMLNEGLPLLAQFLAGETVNHHGAHYHIDQFQLVPAAFQQPHPPFWIGGASQPALRRAAQWEGWIIGTVDEGQNVTLPPERLAEQLTYLRQHRIAATPFDVAVDGISAAAHDTARVRAYEQAGATWWLEAIYGSRDTPDRLMARIQSGPPQST